MKSAQHVTEEKWLQQVAKAAEKSVDLKEEIEQLKVKQINANNVKIDYYIISVRFHRSKPIV